MIPLLLALLVVDPAAPFDLPPCWIASPPPAENSPEWLRATTDQRSWQVEIQEGRLVVRKPDPAWMRWDLFEEVDGGTLVGRNYGEFGGGLEWHPSDGSPSRLLLDCNVRAFVRNDEGLHAICGLAHMDGTDGAVHRLSRLGSGKWAAVDTVRLATVPEIEFPLRDRVVRLPNPNVHQALYQAVPHPEGGLLVVATEGLYQVHHGRAQRVEAVSEPWGGLYPNSLVVIGRTAFVGMRHAVAVFDLDGRRPRCWLLPEEEGP